MEKKKIVVLGGGTGTFTVLSGLKRYPVELSAVVSIADDGGSTGVLRDELGVLPPGDIRQCLVALSKGDDVMRDLFNYRFHEGSLSGHSFGNLFLSALEKLTGDPLSAIREAQRILHVQGQVIPVSAKASQLFAELENGTVVAGEHAIETRGDHQIAIRRCFLSPQVPANPEALKVIREADTIVMGPGDLFTSLVPVLLVRGVRQAMTESQGKNILVINLMTKHGQTDGFGAQRFAEIVQATMAPAQVNYIFINSASLPVDVCARYAQAGEFPVVDDLQDSSFQVCRSDLLSEGLSLPVAGDHLRRSLVRHDVQKLAQAIMKLL